MNSRRIVSVLIFFIYWTSGCSSQTTSITPDDMQLSTIYQITLNPNNKNQTSTAESINSPSHPEKPTQVTDDQIQDLVLTKPISTQLTPEITQADLTPYPDLSEKINHIIGESGGRWHIVIKEVGGQINYTLQPEQRINIASVVKVPLALLFFSALAEKGITEENLIEHLQSTGTGGRTFEQLLQAMLVISEEDATDILFVYINDHLNVPEQLRRWDIEGIDLKARRYTTLGITSIFERFYLGEFVSPTARDIILGYLSEYSPNDNSRIGILNAVIPGNWNLYNKRGSLLTPYVVADSAILENLEGNDYIITIFAYNSDPKTTYENLDQAIGEIALVIWDYISSQNVPHK